MYANINGTPKQITYYFCREAYVLKLKVSITKPISKNVEHKFLKYNPHILKVYF